MRQHSIPIILFALLFWCYSYSHQDYRNGSSTSRLDLLRAACYHHTLRIDQYHQNTAAKAFFGGHYYSDKAPGTIVLALPIYWLSTFCSGERGARADSIAAWSKGDWLRESWTTTALSIGFITAFGGVFFFKFAARFLAESTALITTLAVFLGSAPFPYSTMLFSHAMTVGLLSVGLWSLARGGAFSPGQTPGGAVSACLGGCCCGFALASEFTAGLVFLGIAGASGFMCRRKCLTFLASSCFPLLLIPIYSWICFGNPSVIGYTYQATYPEMKSGLYGIQWPSPPTAFRLLFSAERGLFFWSPFFLLAPYGLVCLFHRSRKLFWLCLIAPILQLAAISGYASDWRAGWALGPRYLSPALPLLGLAAGFGLNRFPRYGRILAVLSILVTGLATVIDATPHYDVANPLLDLHAVKLAQGIYTTNLGMALGLKSHASVVPLVGVGVILAWSLWRRMRPGRLVFGQR